MSDIKKLKPYKTPRLKTYGNVEQITQGAPGGDVKDGMVSMSGAKTGG